MSEEITFQADQQGFLVGTRRLQEIASGIDHVDDNTKEILSILKSTLDSYANKQIDKLQQILQQVKNSGRQQTKVVEAIDKVAKTQTKRNYVPRQRTIDSVPGGSSSDRPMQTGPRRSPVSSSPRKTVNVEASSRSNNSNLGPRQRDANGRFIGSGAGSSAVETARTTSMFKTAFSKALDVVATPKDTTGFDPTIDAINELSGIISPAARGFKMIGRGANWLFKRRTKSDEILPPEQAKHNNLVEKHNKEEVKLLKRIANKTGKSGLSLPGGGIGGGLLGGAGKGLGKFLKFGKGLPLIGTALAALSLTDWDQKSTEEKGGSVGSIAGGVAGGAIGSILGPVGTVVGGTIGAWAGDKLGTVVAPYVKDWTDSLKRADIPTRLMSSWDTLVTGLSSYFNEKVNNAVETTKEVASTVQDKIESIADFGASVIDMTLAKAGNKAAQDRIRMREQGLIGHQSSVYRGNYSSGAPTPLQSASNAGKALMMQPATGKYAPLLDEIARGEATGGAFGTSGYDAIYSGAKVKPSKPISQMTVGEVKAYQKQLLKAGSASTAVGKYQFIHNKGAFGKMAAQAGLKDTDLFDSKAQDRLAIQYAGGQKQLDEWLKTGNYRALTDKVAQQWASQKNSRGYGNYDGDGLNKARHGGLSVIQGVGQQILANEAKAKTPAPAAPKAPATAPAKAKAAATPLPLVNQAQSIVTASNKNLNKLLVPSNQQVVKVGTPAPQKVKTPNPKQPKVETVKQPMTAAQVQGNATKSPMDTVIPQNISDRLLAHTVTGGLGFNVLG